MTIPVNYWAVIVAAIVNMVIGFIWFGPLFGTAWMKASGMSPEKIDECKKKGMGEGMTKTYVILAISSLVMAFVLARVIVFAHSYLSLAGAALGLAVGLMTWIGFIAPVSVGTVLWDGKSWKHWGISYSFYLVSLLIMGAILAAWM